MTNALTIRMHIPSLSSAAQPQNRLERDNNDNFEPESLPPALSPISGPSRAGMNIGKVNSIEALLCSNLGFLCD